MPSTLVRWDPIADLADIRSRFERVLDDLADGRERAWTPAVDTIREDDEIVVRADVPGIKPEEITIEVTEGVLTVSGRHEESREEQEKDYVHRERRVGAFSRSMTLPAGTDPKAITASTHDGVLEVHIPMPKEQAPETITITPGKGD